MHYQNKCKLIYFYENVLNKTNIHKAVPEVYTKYCIFNGQFAYANLKIFLFKFPLCQIKTIGFLDENNIFKLPAYIYTVPL